VRFLHLKQKKKWRLLNYFRRNFISHPDIWPFFKKAWFDSVFWSSGSLICLSIPSLSLPLSISLFLQLAGIKYDRQSFPLTEQKAEQANAQGVVPLLLSFSSLSSAVKNGIKLPYTQLYGRDWRQDIRTYLYLLRTWLILHEP